MLLLSRVRALSTIATGMTSFKCSNTKPMSFLDAKSAANLDRDLMKVPGFSVYQLMELAGLSVASAIYEVYPPHTHPRVHVYCGPGNNGGDGLVAARHLWHFGYRPEVVYPVQPPKKELYQNLIQQLLDLDVKVHKDVPELESPACVSVSPPPDLVLDSVFGFSFSGVVRPPFDKLIAAMKDSEAPIVSVDVPSGWDVDKGNTNQEGLDPSMLISLTAPKLSSIHFHGRHFLGGRFVLPSIISKFKLTLPNYPGTSQCVDITEVQSSLHASAFNPEASESIGGVGLM